MKIGLKSFFLITVFLSAFFIGGCSSNGDKNNNISGAGATFPYPIYAQWANAYHKQTQMKLNYQSIGSGGGVAQIKAKTVDFGASDAPLKAEALNENGLLQFPMVIGGVVPVVNLQGIEKGQLKMNATLLADIFLGKINKWNAKEIKKLNPDLALPDVAITSVHRADGSGTTWIFTNYLAKVSDEWKEKVGFGKAPAWPGNNTVAGKGNEGVSAYVKKINGSIGYVEYAYALQNNMAHVKMQNLDGQFVEPNTQSFQAAAANADWANAEGYYLVLTNQPGQESWPITGASFILMHVEQKNKDMANKVLSFFDWAYKNGQNMAIKLHYVPMPENVVIMVEETWKNKIKFQGQPIWQ